MIQEGDSAHTAVRAAADRCVACGLCLPHCPTYRQSLNENESPRGRIALLRALADNALPYSAKLDVHIDHCLACQACEAACPSQVPYGALLQNGRELLVAAAPRTIRTRLYRLFIGATRSASLITISYRLARLAGALKILPLFGRYAIGLRDLPPRPSAPPTEPAYPEPAAEPVAFFQGCTRGLDQAANNAAITVLRALGHPVYVPPQQGCCGALARHAGFADIAKEQEQRNRGALQNGPSTIVGTSSGCVNALSQYDRTTTGFPETWDIHRFLVEKADLSRLKLLPLHQTIAVHEPCSLRNTTKGAPYMYQVLKQIPGADIIPLPYNSVCCGAAGDYFLRRPTFAQELANVKAAAVAECKPDIIVSANIGCTLALSAALTRQGITIPVLHPLLVLARQLPSSPSPC